MILTFLNVFKYWMIIFPCNHKDSGSLFQCEFPSKQIVIIFSSLNHAIWLIKNVLMNHLLMILSNIFSLKSILINTGTCLQTDIAGRKYFSEICALRHPGGWFKVNYLVPSSLPTRQHLPPYQKEQGWVYCSVVKGPSIFCNGYA